MKRTAAEPYREIDFTPAKGGPVVPLESGKTKISIRLDNTVLDYFRTMVEKAGGGNYQTLINDALLAFIHQQSILDTVRQVVREELTPVLQQPGLTKGCSGRGGQRGARQASSTSQVRGSSAPAAERAPLGGCKDVTCGDEL